jgi:hypothetical protein
MPLIPHRFLFRLTLPCRFVADMPLDGDELLDLPESCRLPNFADLDSRENFADVRLAWNETGLAVQCEVQGRDQEPTGDVNRPRQSDGLSLWIDTRDARTSHRASRYCHQFHFLPRGGGAEREEPVFVQGKINRAMADAPTVTESDVPFRCRRRPTGYRIEAFLPATALHGFDPEQNPRLGIAYVVRDSELGEQSLGVGIDFPVGEDPTLWSVLELVRGS